MKKKYRKLISIIFICLITYMGTIIIEKLKEKDETEKRLATIPEFELLKLNDSIFTNSNLLPNKGVVFIYFNTECEYCQHEAKNISDNIEIFDETQLLFISTESVKTIKAFAEDNNLLRQPSITFLQHNTNTFFSQLDINSMPLILVYNKDKELIKKHKGQLKAEAIIKLLEN